MPKVEADNTPQAKRQEKLAINLFDLERLDPLLRAKLLKGRVEQDRNRLVVTSFKGLDDLSKEAKQLIMQQRTFLLFICPLREAAQICDIIRNEDRLEGRPTTHVCLQSNLQGNLQSLQSLHKDGAWVILDDDVSLCSISAGRCVLNPAVFGRKLAGTISPLKAEFLFDDD